MSRRLSKSDMLDIMGPSYSDGLSMKNTYEEIQERYEEYIESQDWFEMYPNGFDEDAEAWD